MLSFYKLNRGVNLHYSLNPSLKHSSDTNKQKMNLNAQDKVKKLSWDTYSVRKVLRQVHI